SRPITKNDRATNDTEHVRSILFFFIQITFPFFFNGFNLFISNFLVSLENYELRLFERRVVYHVEVFLGIVMPFTKR
ncbi:MAG: hypothetical protein R3339_01850, partial [Thermodesulfobacteriota bacterium]|nr:hypothetical protein [Thermodesulfobacteriota bacterium]